MADVVLLETKPAAIKADIIDRLEKILERAREGEFAGVSIAVVYTDGSIDAAFTRSECGPAMVGAIASLQQRVLTNMVEIASSRAE